MMLITMAGMAVVLCGALAVMTEYAKTELKIRKGPEKPEATGPTGAFAAKIKDLNVEAYDVTQAAHDQEIFAGKFVRTKDPGLYLDVVSDEVLFSSLDKLEAAHGHAEFSKPFDPLHVVEKEEKSVDTGELRLQLRSKSANSYLGWVTPGETPGTRRYIINSNALRLVRAQDLEKNGLGQYRALFQEKPAAPPATNGGPP
jgi:peptide-methionine (R)-S-oxide reductase